MNGRIVLLSVFVLFIITDGLSQTEQNLAELPRVISPPPDAASLGRYGNYSVNLFKGEANISIPIYAYEVGNLSVPISISYNSSGIKVDELASNVGLGWSLSAGGVITRTVKGMPDFVKKRRVPDTRTFDPNVYAADWRTMDSIVTQNLDTEPDLYYFNFLNRSGKYIFSEDSMAICIPYQKLKINRAPSIIDEQGIKYSFTAIENSHSRDECSTGNPNDRDYAGLFPSSWYLTEIVHPKGDTIILEYEGYHYQYKAGITQVQYIFTPSGACASFSNMNRNCVNIKTVNANRIKYIRSNRTDIYVEFLYSTQQREDVYDIDNYNDYESKALERIIVHNGSRQIKKVSFTYDYFRSNEYNPSGTAENKGLASRLKLTEVYDSISAPYKIEYNENVNLPSRLSFSQDHYGYYNGKNNTGLIPSNDAVSFSGADRSPDSVYMKANIIKKIIHPTGGSTWFYFEANEGKGPINSVIVNNMAKTVNCNIGCRFKKDSIVLTSQNDVYYSDFKLSYRLPDGQDRSQGAIFGPDDYFLPLVGTETNEEIAPLAPGTYYFEIETPNDVDNVFITLQWKEKKDTSYIGRHISGGLRIKQIVDSAGGNLPPAWKTYSYNVPGTTDSSSLVDFRAFKYLGEYRKKSTNPDYTYCTGFPLCFSKVLSSSAEQPSYLDYSGFYGYQYVTVFNGTENNNAGKTVNKFSTSIHDFSFEDNSDKSDMLVDWSKGHLLESFDYRFNPLSQTYTPVRKSFSEYKAYFDEGDYWSRPDSNFYTTKNEKFVSAFSYKRYQFGGQMYSNGDICNCVPVYDPRSCVGTYTNQYEYPEFEVAPYFISSAWYHKSRDSVIVYDQVTNDFLVSVSNYFYDSPSHIQLTKIQQPNSKGRILTTEFKYPHDFVIQAVYDTMVARNMISNIVEQKKRNDGNITMQQKVFYGFSNGIIVQDSVQAAMGNSALATEVKFEQYDNNGNLLKLSSVGNPPVSFIWGYNSTYPIAEVVNAPVTDIFHTSFEDAGGNSTAGDSKTGRKSRTGGYSESLTGLSNGSYLLTYWQKTGGNWNLQKTDVTVSNGTYAINLTGQVDEIRFCPATAQMTTYTYDPLIGMTSQCDVNSRIIYYEYDSFGRLQYIRDHDKNIIKSLDYKYQQQQ